MPIPQNKTELLEAIRSSYAKLEQDLITIPVELTNQKELDGHAKGTQMSVHNLVAYLLGWGELVRKWHRLKSKEVEVKFPEEDYQWNELGLLAQKFYTDYEMEAFADLLEKLDQTVKALLQIIESHSNEELYKTLWYKKYTMGRMIQLNTSSPYKNARSRIRKWKKWRKEEEAQ